MKQPSVKFQLLYLQLYFVTLCLKIRSQRRSKNALYENRSIESVIFRLYHTFLMHVCYPHLWITNKQPTKYITVNSGLDVVRVCYTSDFSLVIKNDSSIDSPINSWGEDGFQTLH